MTDIICRYCGYKGVFFEDIYLQHRVIVNELTKETINCLVKYNKCMVCGNLNECKEGV